MDFSMQEEPLIGSQSHAMDSVAMLGLSATTAQLIKLCVTSATGLHDIYTTQGQSAKALLAIELECLTLRAVVEGIEMWCKSENACAIERKAQVMSLDDALKTLIPSVQVLSKDVERMLLPVNQNRSLVLAGKLRQTWGKDEMAVMLDEIRWISHQAHMLITTINMPIDDAQFELRMIQKNASKHYSMEDGQNDFTRDLMNSAPYRRVQLALPRPKIVQDNQQLLPNIPEASSIIL